MTKVSMTQHIYKRISASTNKSFTLIEIIIAIIILSIGVFSVTALSSKSYASISLQKNKLIALNLAREEIDIIRSIRDENWLTEDGCDGTADFCVPPDESHKRADETDLDASGVPTGNCDWRCGIGENILDIDYRVGSPDADVFTTLTVANSGTCINEACPLEPDVCPTPADPSLAFRCPLVIDAKGHYQHTPGTQTSPTFFRSAVIEHDGNDLNGDGNEHNDFSIISTVCWQERGGKWHGVCLEDHLYNWAHY